MVLHCTYEMDDDYYVGYLDDYPEHPTQGENLKDFEENLLDIYLMVRNGTRHDIFIHEQSGKKIAVPRHKEMKNKFLKLVLKEIPRD